MNSSNQHTKDKALTRLIIMALTLTGVAMICGIVVIDTLVHPGRYAPKPEVITEAQVLEETEPQIVDGKDVASGFVAEGEYELVKATCTACHSSKLVLQNRATEDGWRDMIRWMQETQNLWDLGENEDKIVAYLAQYLGPEKQGRRAPLVVEDWYMIE